MMDRLKNYLKQDISGRCDIADSVQDLYLILEETEIKK
jgi:hypothetical protein